EGLLVTEAASRPTFRPPAPPGAPRPEPRDVAEAFFPTGAGRGSAAASAAVLGGMLAGGVLLVGGVLRRRDVHCTESIPSPGRASEVRAPGGAPPDKHPLGRKYALVGSPRTPAVPPRRAACPRA